MAHPIAASSLVRGWWDPHVPVADFLIAERPQDVA